MLEIHEIKDLSLYKTLLEDISSENPHVIEAVDKNVCTGTAVFDYNGDTVRLLYIHCVDDLYLFDGIVRTVMFKGSIIGLKKAEFCVNSPDALDSLKKLGFLKNDKPIVLISDFLDKCEHCENSTQ